ncbi:MAG: DUF4159 domain-containing protein [Bacteroidia bacterium]
MKKILYLTLILFAFSAFAPAPPTIKIARLRYNGGGDWYVSPTSLPNLIAFCNKNLGTNIAPNEDIIDAGSKEIYNYPLIHLTGHGNIVFSNAEIENLRNYLIGGGFLNINDSYGMDPYIRKEMKRVFPELEFVELPYNHPIYNQKYKFTSGMPKIHEHDGKPAQGFGLLYKGRLICLYNFETDLGDGWEDPEIHKDPPAKREQALQMGANIVQYVFTY